MKLLFATALSVASFLPTPTIAQAIPQEPDVACYLRQPNGTVVDLSYLCRKNSKAIVSSDGIFLANFRAMANQYPANVRQELNNYSNQNSDSAIAAAKVTCRILRFGGTSAASTRLEKLASDDPSPAGQARQQLIYSLAINQYCPEFSSH